MHTITETDLNRAKEQMSKVVLASCSGGRGLPKKVIYYDFLINAYTVITDNGTTTTENTKEAVTAYNMG